MKIWIDNVVVVIVPVVVVDVVIRVDVPDVVVIVSGPKPGTNRARKHGVSY